MYNENHPPCPGRCGELADECACHELRAERAAQAAADAAWQAKEDALNAAEFDYRPECRWSRCTDDAETKGYCDAHWGTL